MSVCLQGGGVAPIHAAKLTIFLLLPTPFPLFLSPFPHIVPVLPVLSPIVPVVGVRWSVSLFTSAQVHLVGLSVLFAVEEGSAKL